ncbi:MAG TPA: phosphatase PAP2 family protein [Pseudobdellovibrionaceae bacterium]|nr:phosphatase PAP2 family protein [Pseudobdellovibrionaceae bacterium]
MEFMNIRLNFPSLRFQFILLLTSFVFSALSYFYLDQYLAVFFAQERLKNLWQMARSTTNIGLASHYFIFSIVLLVFLKWIAPKIQHLKKYSEKINYYKKWSYYFLISLISSGLVLQIFKFIFGRQRPHKTDPLFEPYHFTFFENHWDFHSFPSGHSQVMFTVATMLMFLWPKLRWYFFGFAFLISFTRVMTHSHFLSDVIIGSLLGYLVTVWTCYYLERRVR